MIIGLYFEGIRMILVLETFPYLMLDFLYVLPSMELMYMAFLEPPECEVIAFPSPTMYPPPPRTDTARSA